MENRERITVYAAWTAVCIFWGTTFLAIRIALDTIPPLLIGGLRFTLAGLILFLFVRFVQGARLPQGRDWLDLAVVAILLLGIGNGMTIWSEQYIPSGLTSLMIATSPFWVMALERLRPRGERVTSRALLGLLLGLGGLVLLVARELIGMSLGTNYLWGVAAIQVACLSWSLGLIFAKKRRMGVTPMMGSAIQMLIAGTFLLICGTIKGDWHRISFTPRSTTAFIYLVFIGSIVAFSSYTYAVQKLPLTLVSTHTYINPVIAVLLGWVVLSEPMGWRVVISMVVILVGVALVKTAPQSRDVATIEVGEVECENSEVASSVV
jgi:drug/metabolite transporter (DMT)-like permease